MPSSPGPTDYKRTLQRFFYTGISLQPQDALAEGKMAWALNIRSYQPGTIEPRYGIQQLTDAPFAALPHSIVRLNDATPYGEVGAPARRFIGAGTVLYGGSPDSPTYGVADVGPYSGDPMTFIAAQPVNSPRPFVYVGDSVRLRKINSSFNDYPIGIPQPLLPPSAALAAPEYTFLDTVGVAAWTTYGGSTAPLAPAPAPTVNRISTTVTNVLFDDGAAPGMVSLGLADFNNVTFGATLDIGASPETIVVHSVHPPLSSTTIAAILYDSGTTGLCTIQPTGSFSVGQVELPSKDQIERRYRDLNLPVPPPVTVTRTVDFPVDSLILLGGSEVVRIQSVAVGPDGVQSFRCSTFGTFAAGATIDGIASLRAYANTTKSPGDAVTALAYQVVVTNPSATDPVVGGVQGPLTANPRSWGYVGTRATQPQDIIRFGIKVDLLSYVQSVRLVLDLSPVGPELLRDYLFYEWRASDLISAIQSASEVTTGLISDAQADAVAQGQVDALYGDQYGQAQEAVRTAVLDTSRPYRSLFGISDEEANIHESTVEAGPVSLGSAISRQLALGNDSWMTLECRIGDMTRVGTDTTLTYGAMYNAAIYAQVAGTVSPITIEISDCYLTGGYGPDVGTIMPPYVYRYSYRSTITGERSNPSPPMRAGVTPRRGRVILEATPSQAPQTDVIDWWRFGGALARWEHVGVDQNDPVASPTVNTFYDDMADQAIDGGERIRADLYQPWPVSDLPRSGTCNVAGTAIEWVSGDTFDARWAADSLIVVNGIPTQLYTSPASTTRLEVVDNCGSGTGVPFQIPSPTILAQPLRAHWGGIVNQTWVHFAVGDPSDPGVLHWSHGNDPDATSDRNTLLVSSASEPLLNGWIDDGIPYVFSSDRLYRITPTFGNPLSPWRADATNCTIGLWTPWFFCPDPDGGAFFGRPDGIWHTAGGGDPVCITDPDLSILFSHDGSDSEAIRNLNPIDFTQTTRLRLSTVGPMLYFDYVDTTGEAHTLVYDRRYRGWTPDAYLTEIVNDALVPTGVTVRLSEPGEAVYDHLLLAEDAHLYQYSLDTIADGNLRDIQWAVWTPWAHGEDPRAWKQWGDAILDMNPGGSVNGVAITPVIHNGNERLETVVRGQGDTLRDTYLIEITQGAGLYSRNLGLLIQGVCDVCDTQRPLLYLWEPAFLWKNTSIARRATDWEDLGYKGAKFIQGVVLRANTFNEPKLLDVEYDGPPTAPQVALQLSILHNGEQSIAYPMQDTGWTPFVAELVRLHGADDTQWTLLDWRFVWEPAPEAATQWETQDTTYDLPGFMTVRDGVMAYQADADVELVVWHDLNPVTYTLPATDGEYQRVYVPFGPYKGKSTRYQWFSVLPFRLFKRDCSVRVQGWGLPGGYMVVNPFGGPSRVDGAGI